MSHSYRARVRMYRQGIGDCLLVQLPRDDGDQPFRIVIDCGVVLGTPDATNIMHRVVDSLQRATGGDPQTETPGIIDLLVITHEHWDHVSAFNQVPDWNERFEVRRVWAGWTENPRDEQARSLDKAKSMALSTLTNASASFGAADTQEAATVNEMLAFFGVGPLADQEAFGVRATTRDGRDKALALAGDRLEYLDPGGEPRRLEGVDKARVYILGPPRNRKLLKKAAPTRSAPETYGFGAAEGGMIGIHILNAALQDATGGPFSPSFEIPALEAENIAFFQEHYLNAAEVVVSDKADDRNEKDEQEAAVSEMLGDASWRKIDHEWAGVASDLAMKLDSATNNTSLAFAIELEPDGDVLLFPADAQVGNWLSWHDVEWTGLGKDKSAKDLLARTCFYKVGHHGSHNATLKEKGLQMMEHPGLIAMVPVNRAVAAKKKWTEMPLKELMEELSEKTRGRLLCADDDSFPKKPKGVKKAVWDAFTNKVSTTAPGEPEDNLYFEVEL